MTNITQIKNSIEPIAKKYGLKRVFLFGSYAKGNANENSDVDFLIEKGNKSFSLLKLSNFLQEVQSVLNLSVDVVTTAGIADDFRKSIMGSEILIYEE